MLLADGASGGGERHPHGEAMEAAQANAAPIAQTILAGMTAALAKGIKHERRKAPIGNPFGYSEATQGRFAVEKLVFGLADLNSLLRLVLLPAAPPKSDQRERPAAQL